MVGSGETQWYAKIVAKEVECDSWSQVGRVKIVTLSSEGEGLLYAAVSNELN